VSLVAIGLNHRSVPLELLERMTVSDAALPKALGDLVEREHVREAVVLSTCNRTEVYAAVEKFHGAYHDIREWFSELAFLPPEEFTDHLYVHYDTEAAAHLFTVATGLDSAVLGESEILGQIKRAWEHAQSQDATGPAVNLLFRHAVEVGKRARTETAISRGITSVAQAAVVLADRYAGGLADRRVLVLGAGEMGQGIVATLATAGLDELLVANRTWERSVELASVAQATPVRLGDLADTLAGVDVLLSSTGAPTLMLEAAEVEAAVAARPPGAADLLVVDVAVPRDIDPAVAHLEGVRLLDMDDLRAFVESGLDERRAASALVAAVLDEELDRYAGDALAREVAPLVTSLHEHADGVRRAEMERFAARLAELEPRERQAVEALTRGIVAKLLHDPTVELKDAAGTARGERLADALRDLFPL
jgi:glutamyl-tRNA reductase